jgi:hypothetical protein
MAVVMRGRFSTGADWVTFDPASTGHLMAALPELRRIIRNTTRLPGRTLETLRRRFDPRYDLEREAKSRVRWLAPGQLERLTSVPGMCDIYNCRLVALLVLDAPSGGVVVEIGAWKGRMTAWLVEAVQQRPDPLPVISIDPHAGELGESWDDFCQTVADFRLAERGLQVIRERSHDAARSWTRPIAMLWIDGSHDYEDVARDIVDYVPHVVADGIIALDDSAGGLFPGVERAIAEWAATSSNIQHVATLRNVSIFRKVG